MGAPELLALSLGLSIAVAALGWVGGRLFERLSADPRLRDRVWAAALILPALPPLAVGLLLLTPAPVREIPRLPASPATTILLAPAEVLGAVPPPAFVFDATMAAWAVLGIAALLTAARLAALGHRTRRLIRMIRQARTAGPAVTAMVETAARDLAIPAPRVGVSAATSEALLASLGRARLILPVGLTEGADAVAASAVIAHELAHLKRGDHRALWLEEVLLVLLAVNPLMPVLRARRAAAREEACDALALSGAGPEARRLYAQSLIDALRSRAGPQALPALTFTGARRTQAMSRLKAVLKPAAPAGRGPRLMALGLGALVAVLAGAGSLAVAAEREAVLREPPVSSASIAPAASPVSPASPDDQPRIVELGAGARELLNGAPLPEGLPVWALAPERIEVRTPPAGSGEVNFILPFTGSTPVSVNGRRMPAGFPASGVNGDAVARVDIVGDHVRYTLKPEAEARRPRRDAEAGQSAADTAQNSLTSEQQARYRTPTASQYQALCASTDAGDDGFCAGVMFAQLGNAPGNGFCPPASLEQGDADARRAALGALVARGKAEIARGPVRQGDTASDLARTALARAYPCTAARAEAAPDVVVQMPVELVMGGASFGPDDEVRIALTGRDGILAQASARGLNRGPGGLRVPLTTDQFPGLGEGNRSYTLTGEVRDAGGVIRHVADPVVVRLAPGSQGSARNLGAVLTFRPV